ncbi:MAG: glycine cleavage T C-terminal barrel domain-containing protein [Bryobacterales bacterium]|nr:glycine cleavage T C-terminal barrel domain-containing protein [Bryobacterales bacterium]
MRGYEALREKAAWIDLSARGKIVARGADRARLLHAMTTNHVEQLKPGGGCYAFFLNAQGRILGDVNLLCRDQDFLLDTEPETHAALLAHLDRYIIADDVTLEDLTPQMATIAVEGPRAAEAASALGLVLPETPGAFGGVGGVMTANLSHTGAPGFWLIAPGEAKEVLIGEVEAAGAMEADAEAVRVVRIEHGQPRYGEDITDVQLPQETQALQALHFNKGCYIGQEIVERVRSRGHVNRLLVRLTIDSVTAPARGAIIEAGGKLVGEITSAAFSPALGTTVALGYVRAACARPDLALVVDGAPARVVR